MPKENKNQKHFGTIKVPNVWELEQFKGKKQESPPLSMTNKIEINDIGEKVVSHHKKKENNNI